MHKLVKFANSQNNTTCHKHPQGIHMPKCPLHLKGVKLAPKQLTLTVHSDVEIAIRFKWQFLTQSDHSLFNYRKTLHKE